jgi:hypothetical protein
MQYETIDCEEINPKHLSKRLTYRILNLNLMTLAASLQACAPACQVYAMPLGQPTTQLVNLNVFMLLFRPA